MKRIAIVGGGPGGLFTAVVPKGRARSSRRAGGLPAGRRMSFHDDLFGSRVDGNDDYVSVRCDDSSCHICILGLIAKRHRRVVDGGWAFSRGGSAFQAGCRVICSRYWPYDGGLRIHPNTREGGIFSTAYLVVLLPWTIRNACVFHVFQPVAPVYCNMPGEFVPKGYFIWFRIWADSERYLAPLYWTLGPDKPMDFDEVPPQAFDTESERERVAELFERYNHPQVASQDSASATVGEGSDQEEEQAAMTPEIAKAELGYASKAAGAARLQIHILSLLQLQGRRKQYLRCHRLILFPLARDLQGPAMRALFIHQLRAPRAINSNNHARIAHSQQRGAAFRLLRDLLQPKAPP